MTTLYDLGALTVTGYRLRTGDNTTASASVTAALYEAELLMQEELRRELPLKSRSESMVITDPYGRMYPKAWPITVATGHTIDGRTLLGGTTDLATWVGLIDSGYAATRRETVTYTGGFDATTLPITLAHAIYDLARALATDASPVPVGATSVSVGDVSVSYGSAQGSAGVDALVPGLSARVARYKARWI